MILIQYYYKISAALFYKVNNWNGLIIQISVMCFLTVHKKRPAANSQNFVNTYCNSSQVKSWLIFPNFAQNLFILSSCFECSEKEIIMLNNQN